jgi:hypothetical protein
MARLRIEAITCAPAPLRTRERSSSKVTSRTQWRRFSIVQWPRLKASKRAGVARSGGEAAETLHGFPAVFLRNHLRDLAPDSEDLRGMGEVQVTVQFRAGPDGADFHAAMTFIEGGVLRGE